MFWFGLLVGIAVGFIISAIAQVEIEKRAITDGCVKLNGRMFDIVPWRKEKGDR